MESLKYLYDKAAQSINTFIKNTDGDLNLFGKVLTIILIFVAIIIIVKFASRLIDRTLTNKNFDKFQISDRRRDTLTNILKKVVKYILFFIGVVMALEIFSINTASIIATAGIGGLAIGFGAQSLVKDIITGFFILLEDQYAVGDYIQIDTKEGIVEELGVRVTKIRDFTGELHIIPNSSINVVTNRTRGAMRALVDISIAYEADIDKAMEIMERISAEIAETNDNIIEGPLVLGVASFGNSDVVIRAIAKTRSMEQWAVEREMRKKYKQAFDREGIEIPYSKVVVYGGGDK
ncbi:mechanosensitive ion channel family protein [Gudongella sp. DL1XJH-153]|uniref:mechanosensitive ion channel family protein n=1 Tax=Gudongella sp. DL1XJH-153 TaxID=3409804 RepID=UPI003BB68629